MGEVHLLTYLIYTFVEHLIGCGVYSRNSALHPSLFSADTKVTCPWHHLWWAHALLSRCHRCLPVIIVFHLTGGSWSKFWLEKEHKLLHATSSHMSMGPMISISVTSTHLPNALPHKFHSFYSPPHIDSVSILFVFTLLPSKCILSILQCSMYTPIP